MLIYPSCPNCKYKNHISLFSKEIINGIVYLICPKCGSKFKINV